MPQEKTSVRPSLSHGQNGKKHHPAKTTLFAAMMQCLTLLWKSDTATVVVDCEQIRICGIWNIESNILMIAACEIFHHTPLSYFIGEFFGGQRYVCNQTLETW